MAGLLWRHCLFCFLILLGTSIANAEVELTPRQTQRLNAARELIKDADQRTLKETISALKDNGALEGNLIILEAVAATYTEIVAEQNLKTREKKVWLLNMVRLNMAYFQLGGQDVIRRADTGLNVLIRKKLKEHLPPEIFANKKLFQSIED